MKLHALNFQQDIPATLETVWEYFSSPLNLSRITPPDMAFRITSHFDEHQKMYAGMIITYKVSPFGGFSTNWITEITHVDPGKYFVDEQRAGPFAFWHHQHHFREIPGGVQMTDILHYALPLGPVGLIANRITVHKRLNQIFEYRKIKVTETFGSL